MDLVFQSIAGTEAGSCRGKVTWEPTKGERRVEALADLRTAPEISLSTGGHQMEGVPTALVVPAALLATWATLLFRSRGPFD